MQLPSEQTAPRRQLPPQLRIPIADCSCAPYIDSSVVCVPNFKYSNDVPIMIPPSAWRWSGAKKSAHEVPLRIWYLGIKYLYFLLILEEEKAVHSA